MTAELPPIPTPPSASPNPSPSWAKTAPAQLTSRSATFVVATEQLCGNAGRPTTAPSFNANDTRRNEPALRGMSAGNALKIPAMTEDTVQASLSLRPQATLG